MCRAWGSLKHASLKCLYSILLSKAQTSIQKKWRTVRSVSCRHCLGNSVFQTWQGWSHQNSEQLWQHAQDLHRFKSKKSKEWKRGSIRNMVPLLRKKLFSTDSFWEREKSVFFKGSFWYMNHKPRQASCPGIVARHKMDSMFLLICLSLLLLKIDFFSLNKFLMWF